MEMTFIVRCKGDNFTDIQQAIEGFAHAVVNHGAICGKSGLKSNENVTAEFAAVDPTEPIDSLTQLIVLTTLVDRLMGDLATAIKLPSNKDDDKPDEQKATPEESLDALKHTLEAINKAKGAA